MHLLVTETKNRLTSLYHTMQLYLNRVNGWYGFQHSHGNDGAEHEGRVQQARRSENLGRRIHAASDRVQFVHREFSRRLIQICAFHVVFSCCRSDAPLHRHGQDND